MDDSEKDEQGLSINQTFGKLIYDVLGPTARLVGDRIAFWANEGIANVERVLKAAFRKGSQRGDKEGGAVPLKVARALYLDAPFCSDALCAEYFGGILASSKSDNPRDDRGAYFLAMINRMSSYQVRCHYIMYQTASRFGVMPWSSYEGRPGNPFKWISIPTGSLLRALAISQEDANVAALLRHTLYGLQREELVMDPWDLTGIRQSGLAISSDVKIGEVLLFRPTTPGIELFLWGYGRGDLDHADFVGRSELFPPIEGVELPSDAKDMPAHVMG